MNERQQKLYQFLLDKSSTNQYISKEEICYNLPKFYPRFEEKSNEHNSQRLFDGLRIRKLTPKECWRLMGFDDEDIDKCIKAGISDSQLYKQAGNSIVVNVLEAIFRELFKENINETSTNTNR